MSRLNDLIAELCPDGVEFLTLQECTQKIQNIKWKEYFGSDKKYIDLSSVEIKLHCITETQNINSDTAPSRAQQIVQTNDILFGTTRPMLKRYCMIGKEYDGEICSTGFCVLRANTDIVLPRWIYHNITASNFFVYVEQNQKGASYPAISDMSVKAFCIPVPPLEVQREIVRVLDSFTLLTAELTAELTARKSQYEFYRDKLLMFENDIPMLTLKDIVTKSCTGATPAKGNTEYYEGGTIPWIRTQDVRFNEITAVDSFITEKAIEETAVKWIPENCVIIAISGATAGRCAINKIKATTNQHCLNLQIDARKALYKYVYYCICNKQDELISKKQGARGDLNSLLILGIKIPLPKLEIQKKIVQVLDNFEAICTDLNIGLPAEIEARQKQYEYYRDLLLTFAEKDSMLMTDRQTDRHN